MSEYETMKAQKEEILSRELQVICSSCGGTCIYKREKNRVVFTHYCTPPQVRERIFKTSQDRMAVDSSAAGPHNFR